MNNFFYVYVLFSEKDNKRYTGYTTNLAQRLKSHNEGDVSSTKHRRPLHLIYFEGCLNEWMQREEKNILKQKMVKCFSETDLSLI